MKQLRRVTCHDEAAAAINFWKRTIIKWPACFEIDGRPFPPPFCPLSLSLSFLRTGSFRSEASDKMARKNARLSFYIRSRTSKSHNLPLRYYGHYYSRRFCGNYCEMALGLPARSFATRQRHELSETRSAILKGPEGIANVEYRKAYAVTRYQNPRWIYIAVSRNIAAVYRGVPRLPSTAR